MKSYRFKTGSRNNFIFASSVLQAANAELVPLIPVPHVATFTTMIIQAGLVWLMTEETSQPQTSAGPPPQGAAPA